jgi:hypothetical protein
VVLSVVVRWRPVVTGANGKLVAQPARLTWHMAVSLAPSLTAG